MKALVANSGIVKRLALMPVLAKHQQRICRSPCKGAYFVSLIRPRIPGIAFLTVACNLAGAG